MRKTDEILLKYPKDKQYLIAILHEIKEAEPDKYISEKALEAVAQYLKINKGVVYGVASYYSMFSLKPSQPNTLNICCSPVCAHAGADELYDAITSDNNLKNNMEVAIGRCECLGLCAEAPAAALNNEPIAGLTTDNVHEKIISVLKSEGV
ncbi:MAG: NAD(P)H-dependent oxidoreductase subunit E [Bacteroidota bacterium]